MEINGYQIHPRQELQILRGRIEHLFVAVYNMSSAVDFRCSTKEVVDNIKLLESFAEEAKLIQEEYLANGTHNESLYVKSMQEVHKEASKCARKTMKLILKLADNYEG